VQHDLLVVLVESKNAYSARYDDVGALGGVSLAIDVLPGVEVPEFNLPCGTLGSS
jgi:hypothetical protein